jgi:hypothetical protein
LIIIYEENARVSIRVVMQSAVCKNHPGRVCMSYSSDKTIPRRKARRFNKATGDIYRSSINRQDNMQLKDTRKADRNTLPEIDGGGRAGGGIKNT